MKKNKKLRVSKRFLAYLAAGVLGFSLSNCSTIFPEHDTNVSQEDLDDEDDITIDLSDSKEAKVFVHEKGKDDNIIGNSATNSSISEDIVVTGSSIKKDNSTVTPSSIVEDNTVVTGPSIVESTEVEKEEKIIYNYPKNTYGYTVKSIKLNKIASNNKKTKNKLPAYQKVKMVKKEDGWILVKSEGKKGYIKENNIKKINGKFVEIDISGQKLRIYNKAGELVLKSNIVSGTDTSSERRSDRGAFEIFYKATNKELKGPGYSSFVKYFAAYNNGEGLHDATWRSSFGGNIYKYNGSHGCINLPPSVAPKVYKKVDVGTRVIVHD